MLELLFSLFTMLIQSRGDHESPHQRPEIEQFPLDRVVANSTI